MHDDFYLPPDYLFLPLAEVRARIDGHTRRRCGALRIIAHDYQRPEVRAAADLVGDGVALAREAARTPARELLVATVRYAAENAALLRGREVAVVAVDVAAGCPMSDEIALGTLERVLERMELQSPVPVIPVASLASTLEHKAWCGARGGITCGSSNASTVVASVLASGRRVLFLPDRHLGRHAARACGLEEDDIWDTSASAGPDDEARLAGRRFALAAGSCHVHGRLELHHVERARAAHADALVLVHRDAPAAVAAAADLAAGLPEIEAAVGEADPQRPLLIGSEAHVVDDLRVRHPGRRIEALDTAFCPTMYMVHPAAVLHALDHFDERRRESLVPEGLRGDARDALARMLEIDAP